MVKNKMLPDFAVHPSLVSFFLSLALTDAIHPEGTPGSCWGWTQALAHGEYLAIISWLNGMEK